MAEVWAEIPMLTCDLSTSIVLPMSPDQSTAPWRQVPTQPARGSITMSVSLWPCKPSKKAWVQ